MSPLVKNTNLKTFLIISVILHISLMFLPAQLPNLFSYKLREAPEQSNRFKIHSLKTVGDAESKREQKSIYLEPKKLGLKNPSKILNTGQLAPHFAEGHVQLKNVQSSSSKRPQMPIKEKAIKKLSLNKKSIKDFLKDTPNSLNANQFMKALGETDNLVKLEVPKGVREDELNKHELVFYSFQKRTALNYINSFYKKLNDFELQNPHLKFPMTNNKQRMVGRVVYDKNGDIVRINVLQWSNVEKLQDFFLSVLKEMNSLPNPPDEILTNDQFTVFYALTVNEDNIQ